MNYEQEKLKLGKEAKECALAHPELFHYATQGGLEGIGSSQFYLGRTYADLNGFVRDRSPERNSLVKELSLICSNRLLVKTAIMTISNGQLFSFSGLV